jgi:rubrerythrin
VALKISESHPSDGDGVQVAMTALYSWNYGSEIDQLRTLYANALDRQWIALRDLPWERDIDREAFSSSFSLGPARIERTRFWRNLDPDVRWKASAGMATFLLSNFLHGEQGALMVAGELVSAVPHMDAKFYAATQTLDEARHVEVFSAYIDKLGEVQPLSPAVKGVLDATIATDDWMLKLIGMQIVTEGLALHFFRDMRMRTREPLLKQLLTLVSRDEARHTGYGIKYLGELVPKLSPERRAELEDFAFEAARVLVDSRSGTTLRDSAFAVMREAGLDLEAALPEILKEREALRPAGDSGPPRRGAVRGFIIPSLRSVGLFSPRIEACFDEMFAAMPGVGLGPIANDPRELPDDLEAWVNEGA